MKKILASISTSLLLAATLAPCAISAEAASAEARANITCKMKTLAQEQAEEKVAAAKISLHNALANYERHHDACELGRMLAIQAMANADVYGYERYIAKKQNKPYAELEKRAKAMRKRFNTITTNMAKLESNEEKATDLLNNAEHALTEAEAELAKLKTCATQPKADPIPFPIPKVIVAQAALEKAQATYDAACEEARKSTLQYNLAAYDRSVADVDYMLAQTKSDVVVRQDLVKQADAVFKAAADNLATDGLIELLAKWHAESVHNASHQSKATIKAADAALQQASADLRKAVIQFDKARALAAKAHADLSALLAPASYKLATAQLRVDIAGDSASWDQNQMKRAEAALAKAKSAFESAKEEAAR